MLESPLDCKEIKPVNPNGNLPWIFPGRAAAEAETPNTLTSWWKEPTHWKRPWCWERQRVEGEGDDRGWDGWMASPTQWTWVWANSRRHRRTGKPGVLQFVGSQSQTQLSDWTTRPQLSLMTSVPQPREEKERRTADWRAMCGLREALSLLRIQEMTVCLSSCLY